MERSTQLYRVSNTKSVKKILYNIGKGLEMTLKQVLLKDQMIFDSIGKELYRGFEVEPIDRRSLAELARAEAVARVLGKERPGVKSAGGIDRALESWRRKPSDLMIFVVDSSTFLSSESLQDLLKILEDLKETAGNGKLVILLPSLLYSAVEEMRRVGVSSNKQTLEEIFYAWLNSDGSAEDKEHAEYIIKGLVDNTEYRSNIEKFISSFSPQKTEDYISTATFAISDKRVHEFVNREEINELLPKHAADVLYQTLFASARLGAGILNFGNRLKNIIVRLGKRVKEIRSQFKREIKDRANVKRALKIGFVVISIATTEAILSASHGMAVAWNEIIKAGIEEGLVFLILNGL